MKYWCKSCDSPHIAEELKSGQCEECRRLDISYFDGGEALRPVKQSTLNKPQERYWIRPKYIISYTHGGRRLSPDDIHSTDIVYRASIQLRKYPYTKVANVPMWQPITSLKIPSYVLRLLHWYNNVKIN
jgi:hypothetical protein